MLTAPDAFPVVADPGILKQRAYSRFIDGFTENNYSDCHRIVNIASHFERTPENGQGSRIVLPPHERATAFQLSNYRCYSIEGQRRLNLAGMTHFAS